MTFEKLSTGLAQQLIEQGLRTMRLIPDDQVFKLKLDQEFLPFELVSEDKGKMVSITLNEKKAA